jgi:hypothetical protein
MLRSRRNSGAPANRGLIYCAARVRRADRRVVSRVQDTEFSLAPPAVTRAAGWIQVTPIIFISLKREARMNISKDQIIQLLESRGNHDQAQQAAQQLPGQVDTDNQGHASILSKFGLNPGDLGGQTRRFGQATLSRAPG